MDLFASDEALAVRPRRILPMVLRWLVLSALAGGAMAAGGCAAAALVLNDTVGPSNVPAKYVPPKTPMLVMVENYSSGAGIDAQELCRYVDADLAANKIAPLVDQDKVYRLKDADPAAFQSMSIQQVGQAVGAGQILYINLLTSSIEHPQGSDQVRGSLTARVRVIDVPTGDTAWPKDQRAGWALAQRTPFVLENNDAVDMQVRQKLCQSVAVEIGKLFRSWQPDDEDDSDDMRSGD
jgi:hypothetical protein